MKLTTPLLKNKKQSNEINKYLKYTGYTFCLISAFPTAMLNGLAGVANDPSKLNKMDSFENLKDLIATADPSNLCLGIIFFSATESILFFLNKRYLFSAGKTTLDLVRRTVLTLRDKMLRRDIDPANSATLFENLLFVGALANSFTFAELGAEALSFFGDVGKGLGFALSLSVYFSTRYSGATFFFSKISDKNFMLKKEYLEKVTLVKQDYPQINISAKVNNNVNQAVINFLEKLDELGLVKKPFRKVVNYIQLFSGYSLVALTTLPIFASYIPSSVKGAELLTGMDIGANENYQNAGSFIFGILSTALTWFFYELHTKDLPKHLSTTTFLIHQKIRHEKNKEAFFVFSLTLLAFAASYCTGMGFKLAADDALESGYLSYLGNTTSKIVPLGLFVSIITMFWSHLQDLINQSYETELTAAELTHVELSDIELNSTQRIDMNNINGFLRDPKINIQSIKSKPSQGGIFKISSTNSPLADDVNNASFQQRKIAGSYHHN